MKRSIVLLILISVCFLVMCGGFYTIKKLHEEGHYKLVKTEPLKKRVYLISQDKNRITREGFIVVVVELVCQIQGATTGEISKKNLMVNKAFIKQYSFIEKIDNAALDYATNYEPQYLTEYEKNDILSPLISNPNVPVKLYRIYLFKDMTQ